MPSVEGVDNNVPQRGYGVHGESQNRFGVDGRSNTSYGVYGHSETDVGVVGGGSNNIIGVEGYGGLYGLYGFSPNGTGTLGYSNNHTGVYGVSDRYIGVYGQSNNDIGIYGYSENNIALYALSPIGVGVYGYSGLGYAAYLEGRVYILGPLVKPGGSFKIDHPLDPANKYLSHSFVESPDMKNVYDDVVELDNKGEAEIQLPDWFDVLNKDFRYQLTAIGAPGPNLYIAEELISESATTSKPGSDNGNDSGHNNNNGNRFKIAGGKSGMKVSWQVTGIRKDPWANSNRIQVEEDKSDNERGYYLYPDLYGQSEDKSISRLLLPEWKRKMEEPVVSELKPKP